MTWSSAFSHPLAAVLLLAAYPPLRRAVPGESGPLILTDPEMRPRSPVFVLEYLRKLLPWLQQLYLEMPAGWNVSHVALSAVGS